MELENQNEVNDPPSTNTNVLPVSSHENTDNDLQFWGLDYWIEDDDDSYPVFGYTFQPRFHYALPDESIYSRTIEFVPASGNEGNPSSQVEEEVNEEPTPEVALEEENPSLSPVVEVVEEPRVEVEEDIPPPPPQPVAVVEEANLPLPSEQPSQMPKNVDHVGEFMLYLTSLAHAVQFLKSAKAGAKDPDFFNFISKEFSALPPLENALKPAVEPILRATKDESAEVREASLGCLKEIQRVFGLDSCDMSDDSCVDVGPSNREEEEASSSEPVLLRLF